MVVGELELSRFLFSDPRLAQNPCKNSSTKIVKVNFMDPEREIERTHTYAMTSGKVNACSKVEFICANSFAGKPVAHLVGGKHRNSPLAASFSAGTRTTFLKSARAKPHTKVCRSIRPANTICVWPGSRVHTLSIANFALGTLMRYDTHLNRGLWHIGEMWCWYTRWFQISRCYSPTSKRCQRTWVFRRATLARNNSSCVKSDGFAQKPANFPCHVAYLFQKSHEK